MGHQHHLSRRKGYNSLVAALLQRTEKRKKILLRNFSREKLPMLFAALKEVNLLDETITEDFLLNEYNRQKLECFTEAFISLVFTWDNKTNRYCLSDPEYGWSNGSLNGVYYETEEVLEQLNCSLESE
ncbi:TPA: hypothetical protein TZW92_001859 [Streptococcus suis]|nr:hypothetical protein [Streptococcus suis]